jgi:3-hydroxyacyl-CoA dehydrogenase
MGEPVRLERADHVALIVIDHPPVNALGPGVPEGIEEAVERALADSGIDAIVILGSGRTFVAGADIRQLEKLARGQAKRSPRVKDLLLKIERSPKPVVAAIHGSALGGGLELAMACHYRIALASAQLGQPEVKLGIIPGAAGTQRLPRLVGVVKAATMCALGEPISAREGLQVGLLDQIVEEPLRASAIAFACDVARPGKSHPRTADRTDPGPLTPADRELLDQLRQRLKKLKEPGPALRAVAAVEASCELSFEQGCRREEELFEESIRSESAQGLMHIFFGQREVAKVPGLPIETPTLPISRIGLLGAGTMGTGIATSYAAAGISVLWQDESPDALDRGLRLAWENLERMASRAGWLPTDLAARKDLLRPTSGYAGMDEVDLVIEAAFEDLELKKRIFAELDRVARPGAILASNTSTLDIDAMALATHRPEYVVGHHFFSPAHVMKLLEVVRGEKTSPAVLATSMQLAKRLGKVGVMVGNRRGFVGNRMYGPYQREAQFLVEEGASPEQVDRVMEEFGMAMGPLAVGDLAGLDIGYRVRRESAHLVPEGWRTPKIADRLVERGRLGQKVGRGWYVYPSGGRDRQHDPAIEDILAELARESAQVRRPIADDVVRERILLALILEGIRVLEEGVAIRPVDIDVIYVLGYGFPAHRGGPMFHADRWGLEYIFHRTREWARTLGAWWSPPELLASLVGAGQTLSEGLAEGKKWSS